MPCSWAVIMDWIAIVIQVMHVLQVYLSESRPVVVSQLVLLTYI